MKFKSSLSDWIGRNVWVHYTEEPYVKIHMKPIHNDMAGIYLFPESFKPGGNWSYYPYKIYVGISKSSNILDLSKFSFQDIIDVLEYVGVSVDENTLRESSSPLRWFWDRLRSKFSTKQGEWNRLFRDLGYDAIFDDTGTIFFGEVQLVVLNPRIIEVLNIKRQFKTGYKEAEKVIKWLEDICSGYSDDVKSSPLKKKSNDNYVSLLSNIHVGDDNNYVWWKVYVPRMTGRYESKKYAPQEVHISLSLDSEGVTSRMGRGARIGIDLNREDLDKAEKEVRSVMEEVFVKSKEKAAFIRLARKSVISLEELVKRIRGLKGKPVEIFYNGEVRLELNKSFNEQERNNLRRILNSWGWVVSAAWEGMGGNYYFSLESYYGDLIENIPRFLYHITLNYKLKNILKKGLIPKEGSGWHIRKYPNRVFFVRKEDLKDALFDFDFMGVDKVILKIDTGKLRKGTKFYKDKYYSKGLWTYTHIPSEAIEIYE